MLEAFAYVLILTLAVVTLFFAVAFRDPPKWDQKGQMQLSHLSGLEHVRLQRLQDSFHSQTEAFFYLNNFDFSLCPVEKVPIFQD